MQDSTGRASIFRRKCQLGAVRTGAYRDVLKVWLYAATVVLLGVWSSTFFYNAGKALGEVTADKRTNAGLKKLGEICRAADFPMFYLATMGLIALVLFLPFVETLAMKRAGRGAAMGQPLKKNPRGWLEGFTGCLLATGLFVLIGYGLLVTGSFVWKPVQVEPLELLAKLLPWMVMGILVQEGLFRGVILGIFLRALRPATAIAMAAVLFALVQMMVPPPGMNVADPDAAGVGFELFHQVIVRLESREVLLKEVLPLIAMGGVLGYARFRTASLWLPMGLHAGWMLANGLFLAFARPLEREDPLARLLSGASLGEGLIPMAGIVLTGSLVYFLTESNRQTVPYGDV